MRDITEVLGDSAYGGAKLRVEVREDFDVELLAPAQSLPEAESGRFGRADFEIDFGTPSATCPAGVTTQVHEPVSSKEREADPLRFHWPVAASASCPLKSSCNEKKRTGHSLTLNPEGLRKNNFTF